jgi:hypothetical protein
VQLKKHQKKRRGKTIYRPSCGERDLTKKFRLERGRLLDRIADAEIQHGHHDAAERLSRQAANPRCSA